MKGYVSPAEAGAGQVPVEARTEIYRDPDNGQEITVETDQRTVAVGIADVTVSRKKGDTAPVVIEPQAECLEVRNEGNVNGVCVRTDGDETEIETGFSARIRRDAVLTLGYQTELKLTVEREARQEYVIDGDVEAEGDVVMGDQQTVDERTVVEDVVAKDLDVNDDAPAEVRDAAAGEMRVGAESDDSPTQNVCSEHGTYTGPVCPDCQADPEGRDTKYCISCGEAISASARACPACGVELPDFE